MASKAGKNAVPPGNQVGNDPSASVKKATKKTAPKTVQAKVAKTVAAGVGKPARGLTAQTTKPDVHAGPEAREGNVWQERQTEVNRAIGSGGGKRRGDRRDMHPDPGTRNNKAPNQGG